MTSLLTNSKGEFLIMNWNAITAVILVLEMIGLLAGLFLLIRAQSLLARAEGILDVVYFWLESEHIHRKED